MHLACCESQWRRARSTASGRSLSGSSNGCEGLTCPRTLLVRHIHLGSAFACHQTHRLYFGSTRPRRYYIRAHCIGGGSVDIEHNAQLSISRTCRPSDPPHRLSLDWWSFSLPAKSSCIPRMRPGSLGFSRHFFSPSPFVFGRPIIVQEVSTLGGDLPEMQGDWLWHGGNLGNDGFIYGVPCNAEHVLKINPRTSEVTLIGGPFKVCGHANRLFVAIVIMWWL
jgi:hypothetical protein